MNKEYFSALEHRSMSETLSRVEKQLLDLKNILYKRVGKSNPPSKILSRALSNSGLLSRLRTTLQVLFAKDHPDKRKEKVYLK